jgi:hypothetical protein
MILYVLMFFFILGLLAVYFYTRLKNVDRWIPHYVKGLFKANKVKGKPVDIMFLFVDHFELNGHEDRLEAWTVGYPEMAKKHTDSDGHHPKHSFFYALDLMHEHELVAMKPVVDAGYGEFELLWHHDHDTPTSFVEKLDSSMEIFHTHG